MLEGHHSWPDQQLPLIGNNYLAGDAPVAGILQNSVAAAPVITLDQE